MSITFDLTILLDTPRWQDVLPDYEDLCHRTIQRTFENVHNSDGEKELSLVLGDDALLQSYNHQYRGKDKPTNVLSFPASLPAQTFQMSHNLGDILISLTTLEKEALEQHKSLSSHFQHMLVHGLLHLFGYDHLTDEEANAMEELEIRILQTFGIANPYEF